MQLPHWTTTIWLNCSGIVAAPQFFQTESVWSTACKCSSLLLNVLCPARCTIPKDQLEKGGCDDKISSGRPPEIGLLRILLTLGLSDSFFCPNVCIWRKHESDILASSTPTSEHLGLCSSFGLDLMLFDVP